MLQKHRQWPPMMPLPHLSNRKWPVWCLKPYGKTQASLSVTLLGLPTSLSEAVTQYRRQQWCQSPPPPSSLTSNYNDDSVYFHSPAFRRFGSPERRAISFNKISPLRRARDNCKNRCRAPPMFGFNVWPVPYKVAVSKTKGGWEKSQWQLTHCAAQNSITVSFTWRCLVYHSVDYLEINLVANYIMVAYSEKSRHRAVYIEINWGS